MVKSIRNIILSALLFVSLLCAATTCYAKSDELVPVYGNEISDGSYSVEVESSSSMFRIVKAELTVKDGTMTAALTLSGTGYLKLFMGTGEEAEKAEEKDFIPYVEDTDGAYTYTIPVEALDQEFDCAAYSKRKEKWYDRKLVVLSSSLGKDSSSIQKVDSKDASEVEEADSKDASEVEEIDSKDTSEMKVADSKDASEVEETDSKGTSEIEAEASGNISGMADGDYTMEVSLSGGSGKASVTSPADVSISDGKMVASIEWSSPDYDYMIVDGTKYFPINTEGNSIFEIPVSGVDKEMEVVADTVAMSKPHEITYTLTFHSDTMQKKGNDGVITVIVAVVALSVVFLVIFFCLRRSKKKGKNE